MIYPELCRLLREGGVKDFESDAALLAERLCGVSRARLMAEPACPLTHPDLADAVARRIAGEPLQYILGEWDFYGETYRVSPDCLIPRSDTEILVETAIRVLPQNAHVVDLCTGSGCIAVSTLVHRPDVTADALELYPKTLALAVENAARNGVSRRFTPVEADLLDRGKDQLISRAPYDAILSNPPYIPTADIRDLSPEVHKEPMAALDGGEDGLIFYRAILRDYAPMVKPGGYILLEMGYDQATALQELAAAYLPHANVEILRDLGGNDRVTKITIPGV